MKPCGPALAGEFLTAGSPEKSLSYCQWVDWQPFSLYAVNIWLLPLNLQPHLSAAGPDLRHLGGSVGKRLSCEARGLSAPVPFPRGHTLCLGPLSAGEHLPA